MVTGKLIRMKRIVDETGTCIILPACHHMTSRKTYEGQKDVVKAINLGIKGGATSILIGKGFNGKCIEYMKPDIGLLNYVPAYTAFSRSNTINAIETTTVEEALSNGVDGLVLPVDCYHDENAAIAIERISRFVRECDKNGLVFIVEAEFPTFYDSNEENIKKYGAEYLMFVTRLCAELGVDIISTNYTGNEDSFKKIIDFVGIPVLYNGGTEIDQFEFFKILEIVRKAGAKGTLVGRNITESPNPEKTTRAIGKIFREGATAEEAMKIVK